MDQFIEKYKKRVTVYLGIQYIFERILANKIDIQYEKIQDLIEFTKSLIENSKDHTNIDILALLSMAVNNA